MVCQNLKSQSVSRQLFPAPSNMCSDFVGLFTNEFIQKDQYITQYTGKFQSSIEEGSLHDEVYSQYINQHYGRSYTFTLSAHSVVDSMDVGNLMRFVNHAFQSRDGSPDMCNCYPVVVGNGIGTNVQLYARRDIRKGEELYFDYNFELD